MSILTKEQLRANAESALEKLAAIDSELAAKIDLNDDDPVYSHNTDGLPTEFYTLSLWASLEKRYQDRARKILPDLVKGGIALPLEDVVETIVDQAMNRNWSNNFPFFSDVITFSAYNHGIGEHVTEGMKKKAVNQGMVQSIHAVMDKHDKSRAQDELSFFLQLPALDDYYDYALHGNDFDTLNQSIKFSISIEDSSFAQQYMDWYKAQSAHITDTDTKARLIAPIVNFYISDYDNFREIHELEELLDNEMIASSPFQQEVTKIIGWYLGDLGHEPDLEILEYICAFLPDKQGALDTYWVTHECPDPGYLDESELPFLPSAAVAEYVNNVGTELRAKTALDGVALKTWLKNRFQNNMTEESATVSNDHLRIYAQQTRVPGYEALKGLADSLKHFDEQDPLVQQAQGKLIIDLLYRQKFDDAEGVFRRRYVDPDAIKPYVLDRLPKLKDDYRHTDSLGVWLDKIQE